MHSLVMLRVQFDHDVYMPTDEPHGTIKASLTRDFTAFSNDVNVYFLNFFDDIIN